MYEVFLVATASDRRDYRARQLYANAQKADLFVEFHFNSIREDKIGFVDNPATCLVADNASPKSQEIASDFARLIAEKFGYPNGGMRKLKSTEKGYYNLFYANMKAILIEPLYVSDIEQAKVALSEIGQQRIASALNTVIKKHFPTGAKIAYSLGHKYKESLIHDRGAPITIGFDEEGDPIYHPTLAEADCAEKVMHYSIAGLIGKDIEQTFPPVQNDPIFLIGDWTISPSGDGIVLRKNK